jgi:uncharacterized protein (TIGR03435 family)
MSPQSLITFAYEVKDNQISGAPKWLAEESYDIVGKAEGAVSSRDQLRLLLQSLLVDRFKLAFHDEAREVPVYALTVAKGGSKLQQTREGSCLVIDFNHPPAPPPPGQERPRPCGALARRRGNGGSETMDGVGIGITRPAGGTTGLTDALSEILGRPVVDKTGLTGIFDFHLEWTPDSAAAGDNPGPSILTALQQQLGLRVVPDKGPVRMLVIDHVERPVN